MRKKLQRYSVHPRSLALVTLVAACTPVALAQPAVRWRGDLDFEREVKRQYWRAVRDGAPNAGINTEITVNLSPSPGEFLDNYLLTRRHLFGGSQTWPTSIPDDAGMTTTWLDETAPMPWKNLRLTFGATSANYKPADEDGNLILPAGNAGRVVPGFRRPYYNPSMPANTTGWTRLNPSEDLASSIMFNRLPPAIKNAPVCKVFWIPLTNDSDSQGAMYKDEFDSVLRYEGAWQRFKPTSAATPQHDLIPAAGDFNNNVAPRPLAASIGDRQLTYATHDFQAQPSFNNNKWAFNNSATTAGGTTLSLSLETTPTIGNFASGALAGYFSPRSSVSYSNVSINQSDVRCTLFGASDFDSVEVGVSNMISTASGPNGETTTITFSLSENPFLGKSPQPTLKNGVRFRIWNAAEFLDQPGEMVLDGHNKRLYFIPFSEPAPVPAPGAAVGDLSVAALDGTTGLSQTLYVGLCQTASNNAWAPPLQFADCQNVKVESFFFRTGSTDGIRVSNTDGFSLETSLMQAMGARCLEVFNSKNVSIRKSGFSQSLGGFITFRDHVDQPGPALPRPRFVNLESANNSVKACFFGKNG